MPGMKKTMTEFGAGHLHSGSKAGPLVKSRPQAIAICLSEMRKAGANVPKVAKVPAFSGPTKPFKKTPGKLFTPKLKKPKSSGLY